MPIKTWATNDIPAASDLNTHYRDQVISTVTSATRPAGTEGQVIYETDTDLLYIYNGGWVRFGASGAWTSYTPVLTQSSVVTKTVTYAKYEKVGRMVTVNVNLALTGSGTAASAINITIPFTAATSGLIVGSGVWNDNGTGFYPFIAGLATTTTIQCWDATQAATNILAGAGSVTTAAMASGDTIQFCATYESAT